MSDWQRVGDTLPEENLVVDTKIDDAKGCRNTAPLKRQGNLWYFPDGSMYVYYTPTHWKPAQPTEPPASEPPSDMATMSVQDLGRLLCTARDEIESLWAEYEEHVCSCDPKFKCFFHEHLDKSIEVAEASGYKGLLAKFVAAERIAYLEGVEDSPEHVQQAAASQPEQPKPGATHEYRWMCKMCGKGHCIIIPDAICPPSPRSLAEAGTESSGRLLTSNQDDASSSLAGDSTSLAHPERKEADEIIEACALACKHNVQDARDAVLLEDARRDIRALKGKFTLAGKEADELRALANGWRVYADSIDDGTGGVTSCSAHARIYRENAAALEAALGERRE
jgi:rubrerythrin